MKNFKKVLVIFTLLVIGLMVRNAMIFDYITYESTSDFIIHTQFDPNDIGRDFELLGSYQLDYQVNSEEEAYHLFSGYIQNNYSWLSRTIWNNIHVVYDDENEGYFLYFSSCLNDTFGFIYKGTDILYYVIRV